MSEDRIFVDDLVVLGNACPDIISDFRITVCTVGYSAKYGLIRVYPIPSDSEMKWWNVVSVPLERNPRDTRFESWKLQGSKSQWDRLSEKIQVVGKIESKVKQKRLVDSLFGKYGASCVEEFNERKVSLGLIRPTILSYKFIKRSDYRSGVQTRLGSQTKFLTLKNYPLKPLLTYRCPDCKTKKPHSQQVVEWGVYEWMRQHPDKLGQVWENMHLGEADYDFRLLVGNMARHRNSFIVISVFRFKRERFRPLDEFSN